MLYKGTITAYSENQMKHTNTPRGQNARLLIVEVGGIYTYHWALRG
jgi:hypothetical protein